MATEITYDNIDRPYSSLMTRSELESSAGSEAGGASQDEGGRTIKSGSSLNDAWIDTWIKSTGYIPKKRGFLIDGQQGYIECMKLWVGGGGIVGGYLDIPDITTANSFHVDSSGNTWWGGTSLSTSTAKILNTGAGTFSNITITGGSVAGSTITSASLTGSQMQNATITATQIANATITGTQIAAATISGSNLVNATITATQIANATITGTQVAVATITGSNIANATITASQIANATITGTQIANATIVASNITNATITATQIANAAITPIKTTLPIFVLSAGTFTNNSPIAGKVAWSGAKVVYNGTESTITNNNTALTYIVWDSASPTVFSGSATVPTASGVFLVGINTAGTYTSVWDVSQINGAQIQSNSITAGQITNATITATQIANGAITSTQIANATIIATNISATAAITGSQLSSTAGIVGGQIANATITGSNISNNTITVGKVSIPTHFITATWTDHSPTALLVAWATATVDYNGTTYSITAGNTDKKYIWWDFSLSTTTFQVSDTLPTLADADCLIAENNAGVHRLIWNATDVSGSQIQLAAITGANIANSTISGSNLVNNTITASQIANATITGSQIAATTIAGSNIINNTITASQIANATITATQLANATITSTQIAAATITGSNIANATITATQIANATITGTQIANATIAAANITNATITGTQIANATIAPAKTTLPIFILSAGTFTNNSPTAGKVAWSGAKVVYNGTESIITDNNTTSTYVVWDSASPTVFSGSATVPTGAGVFLLGINTTGIYTSVWEVSQVNGAQIQSNSITGTQIANATISGSNLVNATITATQIANNTITATQIANNTITATQIANTTITASQIANLTITASQIANLTIGNGQIGDVSISKLTTGTLTANTMTVGAAATDGYIQSYGWNGTVNGFQIKGGATPAITLIGGTITSGIFQTSASANTGIKINETSNVIDAWGDTAVRFHKASTSGYNGWIGYNSTTLSFINNDANASLLIGSAANIVLDAGAGWYVAPARTTVDLGTVTYPWQGLYATTHYFNSGNSFLNFTSSAFQFSDNVRVTGSINLTGNLVFENAASITINGRAYYETTGAYDASKYYLRS